MRYVCSRQRRLKAVKQAGLLNGVEYVEVRDTEELVQDLRQRTLYVRLLDPPAVDGATGVVLGVSVTVEGGERITPVDVEWVARGDQLSGALAALVADVPDPDHVLVVRTERRGDFSQYRLRLVAGPGSTAVPAGFDPLLVGADFSFKVECPSDFDCGPQCSCPPGTHAAPPIDYLAKDYQGFRRIMLERMSLLAPEWTERNPADVGVALVEMLAYVADELSYRQDAVATEAYLDTARSRVSLRRHARLVDYRVHDGCNARAWVQVQVDSPGVGLPAGTRLLTRVPGLEPSFAPDSAADLMARAASPVVFETVEDALLDDDLNELRFYSWGELGCCLPRGATSATLRGHHPALRAGDVLVLVEKVSPATGVEADADPQRRHPVRLVEVRTASDPSGPVIPGGTSEVTEIRWHEEDRLPFPLRLDTTDGALEVSFALGNIVLSDHGETQPVETLPVVTPARYRPRLQRMPLTQVVVRAPSPLFEVPLTAALQTRLDNLQYTDPVPELFTSRGISLPSSGPVVRGHDPLWSVADDERTFRLRADDAKLLVFEVTAPAATALDGVPAAALPAVVVDGTVNGVPDTWRPRPDLLASDRGAREFTTEIESDGTVQLRFGDGVHAVRPVEGTVFGARYRIGNGPAGNVGAESIAHAVTTVGAITAVANPVPAAGGVAPETAEEVRRDAPQAFAVQQRAVTEGDYAEVTERNGQVQRAAATFRWTGSWHTVFVTADRFAGRPVDGRFETSLRAWLEKFRMAGYDLEVDGPVFVPLEIKLHICVAPHYLRSDVAEDVRDALSDRDLLDGRRGLFHPDNLTFGQSVHLSSVHAAVHAVDGVQSVEVLKFERQREPASSGLHSGELAMGRLEIARLDDDRNFPERGLLDLTFGGGS